VRGRSDQRSPRLMSGVARPIPPARSESAGRAGSNPVSRSISRPAGVEPARASNRITNPQGASSSRSLARVA